MGGLRDSTERQWPDYAITWLCSSPTSTFWCSHSFIYTTITSVSRMELQDSAWCCLHIPPVRTAIDGQSALCVRANHTTAFKMKLFLHMTFMQGKLDKKRSIAQSHIQKPVSSGIVAMSWSIPGHWLYADCSPIPVLAKNQLAPELYSEVILHKLGPYCIFPARATTLNIDKGTSNRLFPDRPQLVTKSETDASPTSSNFVHQSKIPQSLPLEHSKMGSSQDSGVTQQHTTSTTSLTTNKVGPSAKRKSRQSAMRNCNLP